jgi:hypothetical protein
MRPRETSFFSRKCPECGGYVEQEQSLWKLKPRFYCVECGQELVTKSRWRMLLGLAYVVPASAFGKYLIDISGEHMEPETLAFKLLHCGVVLSVAIPSMLLVFRGIVYVPKQESKTSRESVGSTNVNGRADR